MFARAFFMVVGTIVLILLVIIALRLVIPGTFIAADAGFRVIQETLPYPYPAPTAMIPARTVTQAPITPPYYPGTTNQPATAPQQPAYQQPPVAQAPATAPQAPQQSTAACKLQQEPFQGFVGNPDVIQHVDFYVDGLQSVSFIVGPTKTMRWNGSGSIWQASAAQCASFGWVEDASNYARGRLSNGHSGVVVDLRNGQVFNVGKTLNQQQVNDLLTRLRATQN